MNKPGKVKRIAAGWAVIFQTLNARWRYNDLFSGTGYYWNPSLSCFLQKQEDTNHLNANENFFNNFLPQYSSFEDIFKVVSIRLFKRSNFFNAKMLLIVWYLINYFPSFVAISIMSLCLYCRTGCRDLCGDHCMSSNKYLKATHWNLPTKWVIFNSYCQAPIKGSRPPFRS